MIQLKPWLHNLLCRGLQRKHWVILIFFTFICVGLPLYIFINPGLHAVYLLSHYAGAQFSDHVAPGANTSCSYEGCSSHPASLSISPKQNLEQVEDIDQKCKGMYVYIYHLPTSFNEDLVDKCGKATNNWAPMCGKLNNHGYGPLVPSYTPSVNDTSSSNILTTLEPPHAWFRTEQFSVELIFHNRLQRGYPCITQDPELASAFYIPYYGALDTAFTLFDPRLSARDRLVQRLIGWLSGNAVWMQYNGVKKHFMVLGRTSWDFNRNEEQLDGWGSALLSQKELSNVTKLLIERRPWMHDEIGIPYPTSFHPTSLRDLEIWQEKLRGTLTGKRRLMSMFIGSTSRGTEWSRALRGGLAQQCDRVGNDTCREYRCGDGNLGTIDCAQNPEHVSTLFLSSTFCLQPSGDSPTRKGLFDSMLAGCIPVLFTEASAYTQYAWHLPKNGSLYSVLFNGEDVIHGRLDVFASLAAIARDRPRLRAMQQEIIHILPRILYFLSTNTSSSSAGFHDAVDVALENLLKGSPVVATL